MTSHYMEIKFSGNEISPEKISTEELIQIIRAFDSMIFYTSKLQNPALARKDVKLSVSNISSGSLRVGLCSVILQAALAFQAVSGAIHTESLHDIPSRARESLVTISEFSRRYDCNANFMLDNQEEPLAVLTPATEIIMPRGFECRTRIYGTIQKLGGSPTIVKVKTFSGELIQGKCTKKVAKILGSHIYDKVALEAEVLCSEIDGKLMNVNFLGLCNDYAPKPIDLAIDEIRNEFSDFFKDVDPDNFVDELRNK